MPAAAVILLLVSAGRKINNLFPQSFEFKGKEPQKKEEKKTPLKSIETKLY